MGGVSSVQVLDPAGDTLWKGEELRLADFLAGLSPSNSALARLAGISSGMCTRNEVTEAAEQLRFVSRRQMPKGFLTILPPGRLIDESVHRFNAMHLARLQANLIELPLVFDTNEAGLRQLVSTYESQGRMFRFDDRDKPLRLSYAADPNLFAWMSHTRADPQRLPYTMVSPQPVFRRFQSGELSLDRSRQYHVSDVHTLCSTPQAPDVFRDTVAAAAEAMEFWFGSDYCQMIDTVAGTEFDEQSLYGALARSVTGLTIVRHLASRPRYYAIKGGLYVDAGFGNVMLFNFQLDDTNPARFDIRLDDDAPIVVIHSTLASGVPKLLPITLGRGLTGMGPRAIPPELARDQVVLVPIGEHHRAAAEQLARSLRAAAGLRAAVDTNLTKPLGHRLAALRSIWQPLFAVIGDREVAGEPIMLDGPGENGRPTVDEFLARNGERLRRCAVQVSAWADPPLRPRRHPEGGWS